MALDDSKALSLARDAYDASTNYFDSNIRTQIEQDIRQWQSQHGPDSKYSSPTYRGRSRIFRPKTKAAVMRSEAIAAEAMFSTLDVVSIAARNDIDDAARASSQVMQAILQYRLTDSENGIPWFLVAMGAYQDARVTGVVCSYHYWQYNQIKKKDRPWIELMPVENFRFDPAASWLDTVNTSPYCIRMVPMYMKDVLARMTTPDPRTNQPRWLRLEPAQLATLTKQQWDSTRLTRQGKNRTDQMDAARVTEYTIVWCNQIVVEWNGQDYIYWTGGDQYLLSHPVPLESQFAHGRRPFVMGYSSIETHKAYPGGLPRQTHDIQLEVNEVANGRLDNVKFAMNKRYFVRRGRQVDLRSLMANIPGSATMMTDPEKDVVAHDFQDVTSSSYQEQDRLNLDFDDVSGTFSGSSVASNRRLNETVGGMNILTTNQNQLGAYALRTWVETWAEPALRQTMWLEQEYETDTNIIALAGRKAKLFQRFGINEVTDEMLRTNLGLSINVGMGATNPQDKINNLSLALKNLIEVLSSNVLIRSGLKVDELIKEVMGAVGYKDGGRFFDLDSDDPRIDQLMAIIDDLTKELNAKNPPELIQAQVEESAAKIKNLLAQSIKTGVEAAYSAMQAAEVVVSAPMVAPIADMVMKAVGFQPPAPAGADPNLVPGAPEPTFGALAQPGMQEGMQEGGVDPLNASPDPRTNTSPMQPPVPASPLGARSGIETQGFDSGMGGDGGQGPDAGGARSIPPLQGKPDALAYQPRWFKEHERNRTMAEQQKAEKESARAAQAKQEEDERKAKEPRIEDVLAKALDKALAPVLKLVDRVETELRDLQKEVRAIEIPEPAEQPPAAAPVINVEPHIHIDKGGTAKVMEITAPSGQKYKGSIEDKEGERE